MQRPVVVVVVVERPVVVVEHGRQPMRTKEKERWRAPWRERGPRTRRTPPEERVRPPKEGESALGGVEEEADG